MATLSGRIGAAIKGFRFYASSIASGAFGWVSWIYKNGRLDYRKEAGRIYDNSVVLPGHNFFWRNCLYPRLIVKTKSTDENGEPGFKEVEDHPFVEAFENGPFYDHTVLLFGVLLSWLVDGNVYLYKVRSASTDVVGYIYIPHFQIWPMADLFNDDGSKLITYYEYMPVGGPPQKFLPEEIVHLRHGIDPENMMRGLAPLMSALREVVGDNEAGVLGTALMLNAGISAIAFSPKEGKTGELSPQKWDQMKARWRENTTGEMAGSPNFIPFPVDAINLGFKPSDLVLDKNRALFVSRICASIGFDPMVLGLPSEQKTYSNYEEAIEAAFKNTILPTLNIFAIQLTHQTLRPDFGADFKTRVGWDLTDVPALEEDETEKATRVQGLWDSGLIKRSDGRRMLKLKVDEKTDDVYKTDISAGGTEASAKQAATGKLKQELAGKAKKNREALEALQLTPDGEE